MNLRRRSFLRRFAIYSWRKGALIPLRFFHTIKPQEQKIRVCAYARVSSDSDDQLNSFSAQVEYLGNG